MRSYEAQCVRDRPRIQLSVSAAAHGCSPLPLRALQAPKRGARLHSFKRGGAAAVAAAAAGILELVRGYGCRVGTEAPFPLIRSGPGSEWTLGTSEKV